MTRLLLEELRSEIFALQKEYYPKLAIHFSYGEQEIGMDEWVFIAQMYKDETLKRWRAIHGDAVDQWPLNHAAIRSCRYVEHDDFFRINFHDYGFCKAHIDYIKKALTETV